MYSATRPRITVAIGVLALILAAIAPATTWAAEPPAKQDKKSEQADRGPHKCTYPKSHCAKILHGGDCGKSSILFR